MSNASEVALVLVLELAPAVALALALVQALLVCTCTLIPVEMGNVACSEAYVPSLCSRGPFCFERVGMHEVFCITAARDLDFTTSWHR